MTKIELKIQTLENDLYYFLDETSIDDELYYGRCEGIELDQDC